MSNVRVFPGGPPVTDVVSQLRTLADAIESGEVGYQYLIVTGVTADQDSHWPDVYAWGRVPGTSGVIGDLAIAQAFLVNNETERRV